MSVVAEAAPRRSRTRSFASAFSRRPDVRVSSALHVWRRNAAIYRRTFSLNIVPNFFEPFFYLLAMGLGLGAYLTKVRGFDYIDFIAPGLIATAALNGASLEVTFNCFVKMHFGKVYDAIATTPLTPEDIGLGEILWATSRGVLYGIIFVGASAGFGVIHSPLVVLVPFALVLTGLMFAVMGLIYTTLAPTIDYFSYYWTMYIAPMFLFSGIFFPLDRTPEWAQAIAWFMPLHQAVNLVRALMLTGDAGAALGAAAWMAAFTAMLFVVPLNLLRRKLVA